MSQTIHWGYGIFWGGVYGMLRDEYPAIAKAFGLPFGVAFTAFGEGLLLPSMGLSAPAHKYPASTLVRDVTAHWATRRRTKVCADCSKWPSEPWPRRRSERTRNCDALVRERRRPVI